MDNAEITRKHQIGWVTISLKEYESMKETIDILSDADIMKQLEEAKRDNTKVKDFEELAKELRL